MDRWNGIERVYTEEDVERLRGTVPVELMEFKIQ